MNKRKTGRPSKFSKSVALRICDLLISGKSLRSICAMKSMPNACTVFRWLESDKDFREQYARAKEMQIELLADEIIEIADKARRGKRVKDTPRGKEVVIGDMVERSRLQVDARKWVASKLLPKKYGDKPGQARNEDGLNPQLQSLIEALSQEPAEPGEVNE